jgi:hypothetical protein
VLSIIRHPVSPFKDTGWLKENRERNLFFRLFVYCLPPIPLAKLLELDLTLNLLVVFAGPVVQAFALIAPEFYEKFLRHVFGCLEQGQRNIY